MPVFPSFPRERGAEEIIYVAHEVNLDSGGQSLAKEFLFSGVFGEKHKIIDVYSNMQQFARGCHGIKTFFEINHASVYTGVMGGGFEAHFGEYFREHIIPMMGRTSQPIQCFLEQPVFVFGVGWITNRWPNDGTFIVGEVSLTKCVFAIALLKDSLTFNGF
jgi:hypothetical protein